MVRILIIEDEKEMAEGLKDNFEFEGYDVSIAGDGEKGLALAQAHPPDLILLDVMLPRKSGFDVCKELRHLGLTTPVIMLTARGQEIDKVLGLELGADDYITKPFSVRELLSRVKAVLRRSGPEKKAARGTAPDRPAQRGPGPVFGFGLERAGGAVAQGIRTAEVLHRARGADRAPRPASRPGVGV